MPDKRAASDPWVRVILVNYNGGALLGDCVAALAAQTMADFEAIVVDNASTDGSAEALQLPDSRFTLLRNARNVGFAAANNIGASGACTPWIATLNPDTEADVRWLEEMRKGTEAHPQCRMFGATLIDAADPTLADGFGDVLSIAGIAWRGGHGQPLTTLPDTDLEVFSPCAAAALYARDSFEKVGGFDDAFFCYLEDVDLGFRLRLAGERCMQLRRAVVRHHASAITGRYSPFTIFHSHRNRIWLVVKNMPFLLLIVSLPLCIIASGFLALRSSESNPMGAAMSGLWRAITRMGSMLSARKDLQQRRRLSTRQIAGLLVWDPIKVRARLPHGV